MKFSAITQLLATLTTATTAAPALGDLPNHSGEITFFNPGLGACGESHGDGDMITAVSAARYDSSDPCGGKIKLRGSKGDVTVTVVDRCVGCAYDDLDVSPAAFKKAFGGLGIGRTEASWEWL